MDRCDQCGLPLVECNAIVAGRREAADYLFMNGYKKLAAREAAARLIPEHKRK